MSPNSKNKISERCPYTRYVRTRRWKTSQTMTCPGRRQTSTHWKMGSLLSGVLTANCIFTGNENVICKNRQYCLFGCRGYRENFCWFVSVVWVRPNISPSPSAALLQSATWKCGVGMHKARSWWKAKPRGETVRRQGALLASGQAVYTWRTPYTTCC